MEKPKLARALRQLDDALVDLADEYRKVGERHATEHDVFHLTHQLAAQCKLQAESLQPHAERYGTELDDPDDEGFWDSLLARLRRLNATAVGRSSTPGLLLLGDLRRLHLAIEETSMLWIVIGQAAKAVRDPELLATVERSQEEMTKQLMWVTTRIKEVAPQVLAA
ncbi:MAG: hypothetical protein QOG85_1579 [Gaiellaceae bacterium]|jgi:hypothetical protein|nr:hypothetical protein [Gaiellaceae bacterium]